MDETALAFEHPYARASATADGQPLDRISVRDYTRQVEIGAFRTERGVTQRIRFNVVLEVAGHCGATDDDVDKVVSYDTITDAIEAEIAAERINLLETLAERVAQRVLADPRAARVFVRLEKLDRVPGALGVEIVRSRSRDDGASPALPDQGRRVRVFHLAPRPSVDIGVRDALAEIGGPLVVCVCPASPLPPAATEAQRRIGLLSLDQAAWALADADRRFTVASSRTELDWALRGGAMVVWAPTHMTMAALGPGMPDASDPAGLAAWLAGEIGAGTVTPADMVALHKEETR